jgi:hypothetical protein
MEQRDGQVRGGVRAALRIEGLALMIAALAIYTKLHGDWQLFAVLCLAPDVSIAAYLFGPRIGAAAYNATHSTLAPLALAGLGHVALAAIWLAHIGFDRALGFGLKYPSGFRHSHL